MTEEDLKLLNALTRLLGIDPRRLNSLDSDIRRTNARLDTLEKEDRLKVLTNNLTFSWDGPNTKITWATGYVKDRLNKLVPVASGERTGLSASTSYWIAFNPLHQTMTFSTTISSITDNPNLLLLAHITTGTGAQTGTSGGGGTETGGEGGYGGGVGYTGVYS